MWVNERDGLSCFTIDISYTEAGEKRHEKTISFGLGG
jgi:hypothetical protein